MQQFIEKHSRLVTGALSGFDRVRFRGTMRMLANVQGMMAFLWDHQVLLKNLKAFAEVLTRRIRDDAQRLAEAAGRSWKYVAQASLSKEDLVRELLRRDGIEEGLVCVLRAVEPCVSYEVHRNRAAKQIELRAAQRKCLHLYFYFLDPRFGLCHLRVQTWFPFTVFACINGRDWLCRQLDAEGVDYRRRDNCLVQVADVEAAQRLLDAQLQTDWSSVLNNLLHRCCPTLAEELTLHNEPLRYYWSAEETEWATDVMFRSPADLAAIYPSLIRHGMTTFSSGDVLRFLGRRVPAHGHEKSNFEGEITTDLRHRPEGVRIKHRLNENSIKMYDKQGSVLRVETTINNARAFKVRRTKEGAPDAPKTWLPLRKGVVDLPRRAEISHAANQRYLTALAVVDQARPLGQLADQLARRVTWKGRPARGLNPLSGADSTLLQAVLRGEFAIQGFRNRDLRAVLFPGRATDAEQRRQAARITRLLRLLRAHKLIRKIPKTHRYQVSNSGRQIIPAFLAARDANAQKLQELAA